MDLQGDDFVTECVLSPDGSMFNDVDVFASYNLDRTSNDRTIFNAVSRAWAKSQKDWGKYLDGFEGIICLWA